MATSSKRSGGARKRKRAPEAFVAALLRNPTRARILELLERKPGMNKNQLAQRLGINVNALDFHLERLVKARVVETRSGSGRETLCFTAKNVALWEFAATRLLFGRGSTRDIAAYVAQHPGADVKQVSDALGLSPNTVRRNIRALEESELVLRMRIDRQVIFHAEPELRAWFEENCAKRF